MSESHNDLTIEVSEPTAAHSAGVRTPDQDPEMIGPFRILERVGEGGMGVIYKAEQRSPVRRVVALKVIKLGMDTREVLARFEAERQALALTSHPNIARVLDAGMTEGGRPFFAMEFVAGMPLTRYCDEQRLRTPQRLELFVQVCQAVQHAHQKGIIHRDLKPSNILDHAGGRQAGPQGDRLRHRQGHQPGPDGADPLHADRRADRDAGIHVARAGPDQRARRGHPHRHLLARRDPLRTIDRHRPDRPETVAHGRPGRHGPTQAAARIALGMFFIQENQGGQAERQFDAVLSLSRRPDGSVPPEISGVIHRGRGMALWMRKQLPECGAVPRAMVV
jgi:hypothetical protein